MKWRVIQWLLLLTGFAPLCAQLPPVTRSHSGQFIAHSPQVTTLLVPPDLLTNLNVLELKPELLTVSAERVKQSLWHELGARATWRDSIHFSLRPARSVQDIVDVRIERYRSSWIYRVELPAVMEQQRLVRTLVHVILLEIANQNAGQRSAEIPAWLTDGLTQRLLELRAKELALPPPRKMPGGLTYTPTINEVRLKDPMRGIRQDLKEHAPLALEELSWPTEAQLMGLDQGCYRRSAGLFVTELLRLREGQAALRTMLQQLATCFNWQTAFYQAFAIPFPQPLDLEKWWALEVAHLQGRDPDSRWTSSDSLMKLDEVLRVQIGIRPSQTNLPASGMTSLQNVITEWEPLRQIPVLKAKVAELDAARLRSATNVISLVDDYRRTLATYLNQRNAPGLAFISNQRGPPAVRRLTRNTVEALNDLDRRRAALRSAAPAEPDS